MLLINDKQITVNEIRGYRGDSEVHNRLKKAVETIDRVGFPLTIKYPPGVMRVNAKSGLKEGKGLLVFKKHNIFNTPQGSFTLRWAEGVSTTAGGVANYGDPNYRFDRFKILSEGDIEEAIFLIGISGLVDRGRLVVEDVDHEARIVADRRASEADINYLIYSDHSPLNTEKVIAMAYGWGISNIETLRGSVSAMRNALYDRVAKMEKEHNEQFGFKAFIDAAMSDEIPEFITCMGLITRAEAARKLAWDARAFSWILKGGTKKDDITLLTIAPSDSTRRKEKLAQYLAGDQKKKALLEAEEKKAETFATKNKEDDKTAEDVVFERFAALTDEQWEDLPKEDFSTARKMAKVKPNTPANVAMNMCKRYFREVKA